MSPYLQSKTILITGASSGFGKLTVPRLLQRGHTVIAGLRGGQGRLQSVFPKEVTYYGTRLRAIDLHMEKSESIQSAADLIEKEFGGKLDVLINNAGYGLLGSVEDQTSEQLRHQFEVNFFGPVSLTRTLLPYLRQAQGRVLTVSSLAGLYTFPLYGGYSATKYALEGVFEALYYELKPMNVQVALIEPGGFNTEFQKSKSVAQGAKGDSLYSSRTWKMMSNIDYSAPRLGKPDRVAKLLVRLSEKASVPLRTVIGADARFIHALSRLLPDAWRVRLQEFFFRKIVFRE